MSTHQKKLRRLLWILALVIVLVFFIGYALVPLYNVLCDALGINGKTENQAVQNTHQIDKTRTIRMQFLVNRNDKLPWKFKANTYAMDVHPGQSERVSYYVKNTTNHTMTVQAIPSVTPGFLAKYLKKTECFCFQQQTLAPGKSKDMPLMFHISPKIPKNIKELTLSYTLFEAPKKR